MVDVEEAVADGAPLLWPAFGTNVAHSFGSTSDEDPLEGAEVVVRGRFVNQRVAPAPMETNGIAVVPEADGSFTVWVSTQIPFDVRDDLAETLGVGRDRVRAIAPDVGGAFGAKLQIYAEYHAVAAIAARLGGPVRWQETRSESMVSLTHGRAQVQTVELGARRDGTLVGLRAEILADMGAYPIGAFMPGTTQEMLCGVYRIPRVVSSGRSVVTNTTPVAPTGARDGPEATALIERAMDMLATELAMDPGRAPTAELHPARRVPAHDRHRRHLRHGGLREALGRGASRRRIRGAPSRADGDGARAAMRSVSASAWPPTWRSPRSAAASTRPSRWATDGRATVSVGTTPAGHGHETAFAQLASASLGIPFEDVTVVHSDTGLGGARRGDVGLALAADRRLVGLRAGRSGRGEGSRGRRRATGGGCGGRRTRRGRVRGRRGSRSQRRVGEVAGGSDGGALRAEGRFRQRGSTFPFGAHVAVVEVDTVTGHVELLRHVAVDDCGRILNPALVRGQQHGGLGQGIAQALFEEVLYDESGNPVTSTLATYQMPSAADLPSLRDLEHRDADGPEPARREGDRGVGHDRLDAGGAERGRRRVVPPGRAPHRPAASPRNVSGEPSRGSTAIRILREMARIG